MCLLGLITTFARNFGSTIFVLLVRLITIVGRNVGNSWWFVAALNFPKQWASQLNIYRTFSNNECSEASLKLLKMLIQFHHCLSETTKKSTKWFNVTFCSPSWRLLNHLKGYILTIQWTLQRIDRNWTILTATCSAWEHKHNTPTKLPATLSPPSFKPKKHCHQNEGQTLSF